MSCIPPEQMPFDAEGRHVVLYPAYSVGVNRDDRQVAIVFEHPRGQTQVSPAHLLTEKEAAHLILQLQNALGVVQQLPLD